MNEIDQQKDWKSKEESWCAHRETQYRAFHYILVSAHFAYSKDIDSD